jgi:hypothetical protein
MSHLKVTATEIIFPRIQNHPGYMLWDVPQYYRVSQPKADPVVVIEQEQIPLY